MFSNIINNVDLNKTMRDNEALRINKELMDKFDIYDKKLSIFKYLSVEEKIGKKNDEYFVFTNTWSRQLWRWVYSENRDWTFSYLETDFSDFIKYLDLVLTEVKNRNNNRIFNKLVKNINQFIKQIIIGLYNLKTTYKDCSKITCKVDSIIITLIDFKDESQEFISNIKKNGRLRVMSE